MHEGFSQIELETYYIREKQHFYDILQLNKKK